MNTPPESNIPQHVAIIMDGNGRWARQKGLARIEGHRAGAESVQRAVDVCSELGIRFLTLYAFSTENWRRPASEVRGLMKLLDQFLQERLEELQKHRLRLKAIGELDRLPASVRKRLEKVMEKTCEHKAGTLTLCLSYGARAEITSAVRTIAAEVQRGELKPEQITEETVEAHLYTSDLPDPDLIIRTANERRLSNFLLWQASYSELWVTPVLWPDFRKEHFLQAIADYSRRTRRFGGMKNA